MKSLLLVFILTLSFAAFAEDDPPMSREDTHLDPNSVKSTAKYDEPGVDREDYLQQYEDEGQGQSIDPTIEKLDIKPVEPKRPIAANKLQKLKQISQLVSVNKSGVSPQVLKRPQGSGSIKGMGLTFKTNLQTGNASLSIPITTPPARAGLGPSLGLSYSSAGSQGVAGIGWSFGVAYIARQTDQGLPIYDNTVDRFIYGGGHELVRIDPSAEGEGALPSWFDVQHDFYYRAKLEGIFMRVFFKNAVGGGHPYWIAQDQSGTLYYFGADSGGVPDESALTCDENGERVFRWNLIEVKDTHGNKVQYVYEKNMGKSYLSEVRYNVKNSGNSEQYQHRIAINYDATREDVNTTYQTGYPISTAWRLSDIQVETDYTGSGGYQKVRHYEFDYVAGSFHTLLNKVKMFGKGSDHLPPVQFDYTEVVGTHNVLGMGDLYGEIIEMPNSPYHSIGDGRRDLLDVNGDGLPDIYETDPTTSGPIQQYLLNDGPGDGIRESSRTGMGDEQTFMLYNTNVRMMDIDGDGVTDLIHMPSVGEFKVYKTNCDSGTCVWEHYLTRTTNPHIDLTNDAENIKLVDINGDHLIDVVKTTGTQMQHWLNLGRYKDPNDPSKMAIGVFGHIDASGNISEEPITTCVLHKGIPIQFSDNRVKFADVNGDGLQDIVFVDYGTFVYWPNKGHGNWGTGDYCAAGTYGANRYIAMGSAPYFSSMDPSKIYLGDINGDGLADMFQVRANQVDVWLNKIDYFEDRAIISAPWGHQFTDRVRIADMNGSGSQDILWGDGGEYKYMDLTGGIKPRLINVVHNGLGGLTRINYAPSTEQYVAAKSDDPWSTTCPFPQQVVTEVVTRNQLHEPGWPETVLTKRYKYRNCYYDGKEHEFRGFGQTEEESVGDHQVPPNSVDYLTNGETLSKFATHYYYQGKGDVDVPGELDVDDEAFAGMEYMTENWVYDTGSARRFISKSFTSYGIRWLFDDNALAMDSEDLLHDAFHREVRFVYPRESHSFAYNTGYGSGTYSPSIPKFITEDTGENLISSPMIAVPLNTSSTDVVHFLNESRVDNYGHTKEKITHGQVGADITITAHSTYAKNAAAWIHGVCETWTTSSITDETKFNHTRSYYDG
ncbi:VCBS repeat-containing protein, partial [Myxococcota bacterium]|nr:VCBS repeat-containing protein [Myxococcota bacterium]